jgi:predicted CoA-substrate-specific enzyme activase
MTTSLKNQKCNSAYIGVDIGSISTKGVVIDQSRNIIARSYLWTEGNPVQGAKNVISELDEQLKELANNGGCEYKICGVGTTGSARRLVGAMLGACMIKNEITTHAVGTTHLHPDVRTILEIGGQDSKIILIEGGIATDYAMNTLCAAGTGSFLSSQAARLGVAVEDFGSIALTSKHPANIAARCTVFAESDLVHKIQVGYERQDIIAGLCRAVASNYLNNVGKGKKIVGPVVFQGGVSKNIGVVAAFEDLLDCEIYVDPDGHLMGAFGSALLAADAVETGAAKPTEEFDFDAVADFQFVTREIECNHCSNKCEIICVYRDGEIIDSWGNRCDRGAVSAKS